MIIGFEEITATLSEKELALVPVFVERLSLKVGKENAVTSQQIITGFANKKVNPVKIGGARIRKIINYIRMNNLVPRLMATSAGYYVTNDKEELRSYVESLKGRESAIRAIRHKIEQEL